MPLKHRIIQPLDDLSGEERDFLRQAEQKYRANANWFEFEDFAFGMRSPLFSSQRSHLDVLRHPLYLALKEMWLDLGVRQGLVSPSKRKEETRAGRTTKRRGAAHQRRNTAKKRNVETTGPSSNRRLPKSRD